ncbi:MAG: hypothetical protein KME27_20865 [Lyngbya sp. HA4199-MV5]|jgi:hypothetical protein|nr:hypothetical protein [Lyngbya sp. HA4199-MV5]
MTQSNTAPGCWQSIKTNYPEVHAVLQQVAEAIYTQIEDAVPAGQDLTVQVEQAITLGFLEKQVDKIAFVEPALRADYLVQYAVKLLFSAWDDVSIFLDTVDHLYRCSVLLNYDRALGVRSLCTLAHEHGRDLVSRITEVATLRSNEGITHEQFWHLYELFCAALPNLQPEPRHLADALEVIANVNPGAGMIQYEMQGLLKQSQATVEAFYQEFTSRSNPLFVEFVFTTLLILSQFDLQTAHQRASLLTDSDDFIEVKLGIAVLGRLNYGGVKQSELLVVTLSCFNTFLMQPNVEVDSLLTRAYGDLLDQSDEAIAKFVELSSRSDLAIRQEAAQVLCCRAEQFHQQNWYKEALLSLLQKPLPHPELLKQIDFAVRRYVSTEPNFAIQVIEALALNWDYGNSVDNTLPDVTQYTLAELFNHRCDNLAAALTQWFASKIPRLHRAAYEIEHSFTSPPSANPNESGESNLEPPILLNKAVLDSLDELTFHQMLCHIAGYVTGGVSLTALILSAVQREPLSQAIANQIVMLLSDYVLYDYPSKARAYLNQRLTADNLLEVESQIIQTALNRFDRYLQARQSLPPLKELQAPPNRIYAYYQAQWKQNADIVEQAKERSIFRSIFGGREIPIKYGKASAHFEDATQRISEPMRFAPMSYEYDVPQSDVIDPVGRAYQRWRWRLAGFEQGTNSSEINSAEPEV